MTDEATTEVAGTYGTSRSTKFCGNTPLGCGKPDGPRTNSLTQIQR